MSTEVDTEEEIRYGLLKSAEEKARRKWIKTQESRLNDFSRSLPKVVSKDVKYVHDLHERMIFRISEEIRKSVYERLDEWEVREKLKTLESLLQPPVAEGPRSSVKRTAWRPSGNPLDDQAAHDIGTVSRTRETLEETMSKLAKEVTELRQEADNLEAAIRRDEKEIEKILDH